MSASEGPLPPLAEPPTVDILGLDRARLAEALDPWIDRPFRCRQIYEAIYRRGVRDFAEMTELGKAMRVELARRFHIGVPEIAKRERSRDGTQKFLFRLSDGATIEGVDIPDRRRRTLCLSSQAGCALACTFCVTGYWGAGRNLTVGEIVGQVLAMRPPDPSVEGGVNLVFMGMGEPLHNLEALAGALAILTESIAWRRITVSTAGVVPGIEAMARWKARPNLAISLHAADDEKRGALMPINRIHPIRELLAVVREYPLERGRRVTFEYLLIRDFNDSVGDADRLAALLEDLPAKVNLIPVNPDGVLGDRMVPPTRAATEAFRDQLRRRGVLTTVRKRRGDDISAACGQLRAPHREPRGFRRSNLSF